MSALDTQSLLLRSYRYLVKLNALAIYWQKKLRKIVKKDFIPVIIAYGHALGAAFILLQVLPYHILMSSLLLAL